MKNWNLFTFAQPYFTECLRSPREFPLLLSTTFFGRFEALIEREWIQAGHPFWSRTSKGPYNDSVATKSKSHSPTFTIFLDCVWQIFNQFPWQVFISLFSSISGSLVKLTWDHYNNLSINIVHCFAVPSSSTKISSFFWQTMHTLPSLEHSFVIASSRDP